MNVVYLSPHFPRHYGLFVDRLARLGVTVLGITDQYDVQLSLELRQSLAGHYRVESLNATDQVLAGCHWFRVSFGAIDRVESHLESWIALEAQVRDTFDVPGKKTAELGFIKQKSLMKEIFVRRRCRRRGASLSPMKPPAASSSGVITPCSSNPTSGWRGRHLHDPRSS